jgi:hypothetical protein
MAKVDGLKEKVQCSLYDAFFVPPPPSSGVAATVQSTMTDPRVMRFFVDVQGRTKLETNMQAAGTLPSLNSFEVRALRVVMSSIQVRKDTPKAELRQMLNEPEIMADLIYNSVTTLLVGEKTMIEMPTFGYPAGAGVSTGFPTVPNHGVPDTRSAFRFAEPVMIEPQQNFRVELQFPRDVPDRLANLQGPLRIWVLLDGYMMRDVQ